MIRALLLVGCAAAAVTAMGCESTQSRSARLEREADKSRTEDPVLKVTELDKDIEVGKTSILTDANGTAVVVSLRNEHKEALAQVPLELKVVDGAGKRVYKNDEPGLAPSLISAALLPAGSEEVWIHDQVVAIGKPVEAEARAGVGGKEVRGELPRIDTPAPKLENDATSGLAAVGRLVNRSDIEQKDIVVNVVARDGDKVVAAGRAVVRRLKAGKDADYQAFLIGKAEGAELEASAPPTTLK